jgi:hypothetical protein
MYSALFRGGFVMARGVQCTPRDGKVMDQQDVFIAIT